MDKEKKVNMQETPSDFEQIKRMVEENLKLSEENKEMIKKMKGYLRFQKIVSIFYFLLIVVPIILSIIYLPPILKNVAEPYLDLIKGTDGINLDDINVDEAAKDLDKYLKQSMTELALRQAQDKKDYEKF